MAAANADEALREALSDAHAGRHGQASLKARLVLTTEPHNPEAHYVLGLAALIANQPGGGLASIREAARLAPREPRYAFALGMALDRAGDRDASIAAYQLALAMRPGHFETAANLGSVLQRAGRHAEARAAFATALRARPTEPLVQHGMALCHLALGDLGAAESALRAAIAANAAFAQAHNHLGSVLSRLGRRDEAIESIREALRLRPDYPEAWFNLAEQHIEAGHEKEAMAALERTLALAPGHAAARYLRSALAGETPAQAPDDYIKATFDRFAPEFDARLLGPLGYRTPDKLAAFLRPWCEGIPKPHRILDLGCGTGLSGLALRPLADELAGVDLSPGMLDIARGRETYEALHESALTPFLAAQAAGRWNVIVAVDVFVYVGALDEVFREVARVLPAGGLFAFSVERLDTSESFALQRSGRYAHSRAYLAAQAKAAGLEACQVAEEDIRLEAGKPVPGLLAAYRKP